MTKNAPEITAEAILADPLALTITIPWLLVAQTAKELEEAYNAKSGSSPMLARLLDQIEEIRDQHIGVARVGQTRAEATA